MGTCPAPIVNWVRRSNGACSPGRSARPAACAAPAPHTKTSLPPPRWMIRACSGRTPAPLSTMSQVGKLPTVRFCLPKPGITQGFSPQTADEGNPGPGEGPSGARSGPRGTVAGRYLAAGVDVRRMKSATLSCSAWSSAGTA